MNEWFRIIVFVLNHMIRKDKPLFGKCKKIEIFVDDGIRRIEIVWNPIDGAYYFNGQ